MPQIDRREFLADLEATQESRVREKLMLGHYVGWQEKVVERWLDARASKRDEERANRQIVSGQRAAFWTRGRALITAIGVVIAAAMHYLFRNGS